MTSDFEAVCGLCSWGVWDCLSEKTGMYAEQLQGWLGEHDHFCFTNIPHLRRPYIYRPGLEVAYTTSAPVLRLELRPGTTPTRVGGRTVDSSCVPRKKRKEAGEFLTTLFPPRSSTSAKWFQSALSSKKSAPLFSILCVFSALLRGGLPAECKQSLDI